MFHNIFETDATESKCCQQTPKILSFYLGYILGFIESLCAPTNLFASDVNNNGIRAPFGNV